MSIVKATGLLPPPVLAEFHIGAELLAQLAALHHSASQGSIGVSIRCKSSTGVEGSRTEYSTGNVKAKQLFSVHCTIAAGLTVCWRLFSTQLVSHRPGRVSAGATSGKRWAKTTALSRMLDVDWPEIIISDGLSRVLAERVSRGAPGRATLNTPQRSNNRSHTTAVLSRSANEVGGEPRVEP